MAIQDAGSPSIANPNVVLTGVPCDVTVYVGGWVRMNSGGTAINALADSMANSNVLGLCESKQSTTICTVRVSGVSATIYVGLDVTKQYYLSPTVDGAMQITAPSVSGQVLLRLGQAYSATNFFPHKGERILRA